MNPPNMRTGLRIYITYKGQTVGGRVLLASGNSRSLMVSFDGMLGGFLRTMPVLWDEELGKYLDLIEKQPATITTEEEHQKARPS